MSWIREGSFAMRKKMSKIKIQNAKQDLWLIIWTRYFSPSLTFIIFSDDDDIFYAQIFQHIDLVRTMMETEAAISRHLLIESILKYMITMMIIIIIMMVKIIYIFNFPFFLLLISWQFQDARVHQIIYRESQAFLNLLLIHNLQLFPARMRRKFN